MIFRLGRLEYLMSQDQPWYLTIAPYGPHAPAVPCARHDKLFANAKAPRLPWWNPDDDIQSQKSVFLKNASRMNDTEIAGSDSAFRHRLQTLQGVDDIVNDVIAKLEEKGELDNTYGECPGLVFVRPSSCL